MKEIKTITVGDLLGIAKKARALSWGQLASEFKKVETIDAIKGTAVAQLSVIFSQVLSAFDTGKRIMGVIQRVRPILTMAVRIKGAFKNPMYIGEIANEAALLVQKLLLSISQNLIGTFRDEILNYPIFIGGLSAFQMKTLRDKITKALADTYNSIEQGLKNFSPSVVFPGLANLSNNLTALANTDFKKFSNDVSTAFGASAKELGQNVLSALSKSLRDSNRKMEGDINQMVYGTREAPLLPDPPAYYQIPQSPFFPDTNTNLDEIENPPATSSGDETWQDRIGEDNPTTREMMDGIELTMRQNMDGLLNSIDKELKKITIDTTDIEKNIYANNQNPEEDIGALHTLKDGFLQYTLDSQFALVKTSLNNMLKMNDAFLKKIINKMISELVRAMKDKNNLLYSKLEKFILALLASGITDPNELRRRIMEYLLTLQNNLSVDLSSVYKKVLYEYLLYLFSNAGVDNEERLSELIEMATEKFYQYKQDFFNSLLSKIAGIRLSNEVIDDTYFITTYDVLKASLTARLEQILDTANSIAYDGTYKYDGSFTYGENPLAFEAVKQEIASNFNSIIVNFFTSISENTHPYSQSINEKLNIMEFNLVDTIKHLILDEPIPLNIVWEEPGWADLTETEKQTLSSILYVIFFDYKNKLIKVVADAIYYDKYETVRVLKKEKVEQEIQEHIENQDTVIKSKLNTKSAALIETFEYTGNYEETKTIIEEKTDEFLDNFNFSLQQDFRMGALLKENEVSILEALRSILRSI
jgi:hypothetical protein